MRPVDAPPAAELMRLVRSLPPAAPLLAPPPEAPRDHLFGGTVRDLLLGGRPLDLDLVVEGSTVALASALGGEIRAHDRFGTSTVTLNGFTYDLARARRESYAHPGALPDVVPAGIDEDLLRRDFTVNALAIELSGPEPGRLRSAPGGLDDLDRHHLRILHEASFVDDPTRMLRLARYAARLGFEIEPRTEALLREAVTTGALGTVSGPRIGAELRLLAREQDPVTAFGALTELRLDRAIDPNLHLVDEGLARAAFELLPPDGRRDRLVLALALRGVEEARIEALLDRLAFEAGDRDAIVATATGADTVADALRRADRPSEIARVVSGAPVEEVALAGALGPAEAARQWLERFRHVRLEITGADLLAAGVPEGPAVGRGLRAALDAKLDGLAVGRKWELSVALEAARIA
jgi:tRNA nucleotidyltransferase (CCA-adding enzyme)